MKITESSKILVLKIFKANSNKIIEISGRVDEIVRNLSTSKELKNNKSENLTYILNIEATKKTIFLTFETKMTFNHLRQIFIEAPIF